MKQKIAIGLAVVAGAAFIVYVAIGETGPVGWLNAAQQWAFGAYSRKVSMLVLMVLGILLIVPLGALNVFGASSPPVVPPPGAKPGSPFLWGAIGWLALMAATWGGAYAYGWWDRHRQAADAVAVYEPVELASGTLPSLSGHAHLALGGRLLGDHAVSQVSGTNSEPGTVLVPIVESGWREGDPIHFVARVDVAGRTALRQSAGPRAPILVRVDGSVPTTALQVFAGMKAPIAGDAIAVVPVAMKDGRLAPAPNDIDRERFLFWGVIGTFSGTLFIVAFLGALWYQERQAKRLRSREQPARMAGR